MEIFYIINGKGRNINSERVIWDSKLEKIPTNKLVWVRLISPKKEEIEEISKFANIPEEEFHEFIEEEDRSRIDYKGYLQIVYQIPLKGKEEIVSGSISIFIRSNILITVETEDAIVTDNIVERLKKNKLRFLLRHGPGKPVYYILDKINEDFYKAIEKITRSSKITKTEDVDVQQKMLMTLYNSNVTLSQFNQAIVANLEIINSLRKNRFRLFTAEDREEFIDLYHDTLQLMDTEKVQREVISSIFNFQTVLSSYKLNNSMKFLTSLALIMMIPTLVSSIYGMNVKLPFAQHVAGFWIVMIFMLIFTLGLYLFFKKFDWL